MSSNPIERFDTPVDDPVYDIPMDASLHTFLNALLGSGNPEDIQDKVLIFNLDDNNSFDHPIPPQATLENLANMQAIIKHLQNASFNKEEQWSADEFNTFLHPPHIQFCIDDPQLHLSLSTYISLSAHSSEEAYNAVHRSIKECYPDSMMLSFNQVQNQLKSINGILPLHFDMCTNSCMAFTGPFIKLKKCLFCSEEHFQLS